MGLRLSRVVGIAALLAGVSACEGEGAVGQPSVVGREAALSSPGSSFRPLPARGFQPDRALPAADQFAEQARAQAIARQKRDAAQSAACDDCADRACAMQCFMQDELLDGPEGNAVPVQCLACGRETGFLPRPTLHLALVGEKTVELTWDAVANADAYVIHGVRWTSEGATETMETSSTWRTADTRLQLNLEAGSSYTFQLVAWTEEERPRHSQPSPPVEINL